MGCGKLRAVDFGAAVGAQRFHGAVFIDAERQAKAPDTFLAKKYWTGGGKFDCKGDEREGGNKENPDYEGDGIIQECAEAIVNFFLLFAQVGKKPALGKCKGRNTAEQCFVKFGQINNFRLA